MASPKTLDYATLDVFTTNLYEGNPLAVVHVPTSLSANLTQETKQLIAREFNYSETTFLHLPSSIGTASQDGEGPEYRLDIFLTDAEVPLAGHPVIGSAVHLFATILPTLDSSTATKARFSTKAGTVKLTYDTTSREVQAALPHNIHLHSTFSFTTADVLRQQPALATHLSSLGSGEAKLEIDTLSIVKGMTFIYVRLPSLEALGSVQLFSPRLDSSKLDEGWSGGVLMMMFYVPLDSTTISDGKGGGEVKLRTRMIEGLFEDPATGSASSGLGALLSMKAGKGDGRMRYAMTQAVEMGRRSEIGVDVVTAQGKISEVVLGGTAVEVMSGKIRYP